WAQLNHHVQLSCNNKQTLDIEWLGLSTSVEACDLSSFCQTASSGENETESCRHYYASGTYIFGPSIGSVPVRGVGCRGFPSAVSGSQVKICTPRYLSRASTSRLA